MTVRTLLRNSLFGALPLLFSYGLWRAISLRWVSDDAFISFRYAQNLLQGNGLVFNVGERVEGYTNFLWTVITSGGMGLGIDPILFSWILGISAYVATAALCVCGMCQ